LLFAQDLIYRAFFNTYGT